MEGLYRLSFGIEHNHFRRILQGTSPHLPVSLIDRLIGIYRRTPDSVDKELSKDEDECDG